MTGSLPARPSQIRWLAKADIISQVRFIERTFDVTFDYRSRRTTVPECGRFSLLEIRSWSDHGPHGSWPTRCGLLGIGMNAKHQPYSVNSGDPLKAPIGESMRADLKKSGAHQGQDEHNLYCSSHHYPGHRLSCDRQVLARRMYVGGE